MKQGRITIALLATAATVSACGSQSSDTPEQCVERFADRVAAIPNGTKAQTFFTYDVTDAEVPKDVMRSAKQLTFVQSGGSASAVESFYRNEGNIGPAYFAANDISLFRSAPVSGMPANTIEAGCKPPFKGAKLIRVDWKLISSSTEDTE